MLLHGVVKKRMSSGMPVPRSSSHNWTQSYCVDSEGKSISCSFRPEVAGNQMQNIIQWLAELQCKLKSQSCRVYTIEVRLLVEKEWISVNWDEDVLEDSNEAGDAESLHSDESSLSVEEVLPLLKESSSVMSISLWSHGLQPARLLCLWNSSGKNAGVGCHSLLQQIFPTWELNPELLHCRWILHHLSHKGSLVGAYTGETKRLTLPGRGKRANEWEKGGRKG